VRLGDLALFPDSVTGCYVAIDKNVDVRGLLEAYKLLPGERREEGAAAALSTIYTC
jgi:hypothetical protein